MAKKQSDVAVLANLIIKKIKENGCDFTVTDAKQSASGACIDINGLGKNFWVYVKGVK